MLLVCIFIFCFVLWNLSCWKVYFLGVLFVGQWWTATQAYQPKTKKRKLRVGHNSLCFYSALPTRLGSCTWATAPHYVILLFVIFILNFIYSFVLPVIHVHTHTQKDDQDFIQSHTILMNKKLFGFSFHWASPWQKIKAEWNSIKSNWFKIIHRIKIK